MKSHSDYFIADSHLHGPSPKGEFCSWAPMFANYTDYCQYLIKCGISVAVQNVFHAVTAKTKKQLDEGNLHALKLAKKSPRKLRIIPALILHPKFLKDAGRWFEMFRHAGSCWAGELCPYCSNYTIDHPKFIEMAKLVERENFVLQIHGQGGGAMAKIADACPNLTLVISHLGWRKEIEENIQTAIKHPNVFLDISGHGHERLGILEKAVNMGLEDRILYGSDFPINEPATPIVRILNSRIPEKAKRKILGLNLRKILAKRRIDI